jgi:predicted AAA+ superfamily ATPase
VRREVQSDPRGFFSRHKHGAILDEVQNAPELLSYLQDIIDNDRISGADLGDGGDRGNGRWILTGSQNFALSASVSQSLAGRVGIIQLLPCGWAEVSRFNSPPATLDGALLTGGYPGILDQRISPTHFFAGYVATYIERDLRALTNVVDLATFQRFLELCSGRTAQLLNLSALASDAGITQPTAKAWLSILEASYVAFRLPSYHLNVTSRVVKTPKLHFNDSGLACWLLGIRSADQLRNHPLRGAIFESWAVSEIRKRRFNRGEPAGMYFYRDTHGSEADVLLATGSTPALIEIKAGQTILADTATSLDKVATRYDDARGQAPRYVIYGGEERKAIRNVQFIPWRAVQDVSWEAPSPPA